MKSTAMRLMAAGGIMLAPVMAYGADEKPAEIPFANSGGIENWQADGDKVIYLEGRNNQWYRAELLTDCIGLSFTEEVGFVTEASGAFNKFSAIRLSDKECKVKAFEKSEKPPTKKERKAKEAAKP